MDNLLYKQDKTPEDIDTLLRQHKNLIYYILSSMSLFNNHDCESAAWEALWDAVCTFDIYATNAFSTYACKLIKNAINNELRKQALITKHEAAMLDYSDTNDAYAAVDMDDVNRVAAIESAFKQFVSTKRGSNKNVLLVWYASGFEAHGKDIAAICNCSSSYVSRVQRDFRAYLHRKLKEL